MGVGYGGVGGIGVQFDSDMQESAVEKGIFSEEDWDDCPGECMESVGLTFDTAGSAYSGEEQFYLLVDGESLTDINNNAGDFCSKVNEAIGSKLTPADLKVIYDLHIW